jgi:DNA invertase Pin-like site-specific DNA recombinase
MITVTQRKVAATHLRRNAFLYVRQSTLRQVTDNQESTRRQYALRERATALGWTPEQIIVVDCDLGVSGASTDRVGFQRLVAEVGLGRAGIVLGLEVSRLARNSSDWHRLLEMCALTQTLILDEDGLYDPNEYNDRLLLGLKGTLSEAELHLLRARMHGGLLAKARRGALRIGLPVGLVYDDVAQVVLHPDAQVQETLRLFFRTFFRTGSACATVKHFSDHHIPFPAPAKPGVKTDEVVWGRLNLGRAVHLLHNPRYAGAFSYGRRHCRKQPNGRPRTTNVPRDQWHVLLLDAHPGYISWEEYERIQQQLRTSALAFGLEHRHAPPREGPALLQGLALCGRCGVRMAVRYHERHGRLVPDYVCHIRTLQYRDPACQIIPGGEVDAAMGHLLVDAMTPMTVELTLAVQAELEARVEETDRLRRQQLERAHYDVERARRRYMQVDPTNRLVAATLEATWNEGLRSLEDLRARVERERAADRDRFDEAATQRIRALAASFPAVWNHAATPDRERKRMMALLVTDVTLTKAHEQITMGVRFRGGATTTVCVPTPLTAWRKRQTHPHALARATALLETQTHAHAAEQLNAEGFTTGAGAPFDAAAIGWLARRWGLTTYRGHLQAAGYLTTSELAAQLGIGDSEVRRRRREGQLCGSRYNGKGAYLFAPLTQQPKAIQALATRKQPPEDDCGRSRGLRAATSERGGAV